MKMILIKFVLCFSFSLSIVNAKESADAFIVTIFDQSIKIVSPQKYTKKVSVTVNNKTLSNIRGKIVNKKNDVTVKNLNVRAGKTLSVEIAIRKKGHFVFIPLSPAFQEVDLIVGNKAYEIPPKASPKKNQSKPSK